MFWLFTISKLLFYFFNITIELLVEWMHDVIYGNIFLFNMLMNRHYINDMAYVHEYL